MGKRKVEREKRKTADASTNTPTPAHEGDAGERPPSTQASTGSAEPHSALSTSSSVLRSPSSVLDVFCPQCGYNLRGIDSARCPECGYSIDFRKLTAPQLPWLHRDKIGRVRAYWRTTCTAILRKKKFWEEMSRPVSLRDAQQFRWITVLVVYLPLIPLSIAVVLGDPAQAFSWLMDNEPAVFVIGAIVVHLCVLLFLAGATGLPSYFFHPKRIPVEQQNRAVALSYYCCAPLAWLPVPSAMVLTTYLVLRGQDFDKGFMPAICLILACVLFTVYFCIRIATEWLWELSGLHRRATQSESVRYGLFFILLPLLWLVLAGILLVGIPLIVGYVVLVISSVW
ncbi:MAG: zinc ribbon domain-containing protein [Planctomycetota bacterium]|nr:zinc ribbon domain-containing protein [Planctomycetota bacterium]